MALEIHSPILFMSKKEKVKGFLPSNSVIYFLFLRTRKATASNPTIAKIASKPGSVTMGVGVDVTPSARISYSIVG
jgi:hypothetical protein